MLIAYRHLPECSKYVIQISRRAWRHQSPRDRVLREFVQTRTFFGLGEIAGVLANPAETVRSLAESRRLLEETRQEMQDNRERAQLRPTHTFSPLPGFFARSLEIEAIERIMANEPSFTVLFGGSSAGKTAILRQILSGDQYHVLHFDLRIAGIADLGSLYMTLSQQLEQYFDEIGKIHPEYDDFKKESWTFKFDRMNVEERLKSFQGTIGTSDVARIMELFQSSLLKYRDFIPEVNEEAQKSPAPPKKMPVIFFDEAHKLPALVQSTEAVKCLLDALIVLSKQDRLCHVLHATSDPFYQTWLRKWNIMQHAKAITIDDCDRQDTQAFWEQNMLPLIPEQHREALKFDDLWPAFGGKFAHWHDYVQDYVNADGQLSVKTSSHYHQAYSLLNLHMIHAIQSPDNGEDSIPASSGGFRIFSPITQPIGPTGVPLRSPESPLEDASAPQFTSKHLLAVMQRLTVEGNKYLLYFPLCREFGIEAVDDLIKNKVLDLRWSDAVGHTPDPVLGPKLFPNTPIVRFAMADVVNEYKST